VLCRRHASVMDGRGCELACTIGQAIALARARSRNSLPDATFAMPAQLAMR
jgi:hypothetical protein